MKLALALAAAVVVMTTGTAAAVSTIYVTLKRGDIAVTANASIACGVDTFSGSTGFLCFPQGKSGKLIPGAYTVFISRGQVRVIHSTRRPSVAFEAKQPK